MHAKGCVDKHLARWPCCSQHSLRFRVRGLGLFNLLPHNPIKKHIPNGPSFSRNAYTFIRQQVAEKQTLTPYESP